VIFDVLNYLNFQLIYRVSLLPISQSRTKMKQWKPYMYYHGFDNSQPRFHVDRSLHPSQVLIHWRWLLYIAFPFVKVFSCFKNMNSADIHNILYQPRFHAEILGDKKWTPSNWNYGIDFAGVHIQYCAKFGTFITTWTIISRFCRTI
jgi:hypothetical protein